MRASAAVVLLVVVLIPCLLHDGVDANTTLWPNKPLFPAMFGFGDLYADTGNYSPFSMGPIASGTISVRGLPGPLDWMANEFIRRVTTLFQNTRSFVSNGVNFTVSGARALDQAFFLQQNITSAAQTNSSLSVQLRWFEELRPSLCNTTTKLDCDDYLGKSLFFVGEIVGNDYLACLSAKTVEQTTQICVPAVTDAIAAGAERLIQHGARRIVLPGILPMGCLPAILTLYPSVNASDYDSYGCLRKFNALARYHNELLRSSARALQIKYPDAAIAFADYYEPVLSFLTTPAVFGFDGNRTLVACCGGGGEYNFNPAAFCSSPGATACAEPSRVVSWDGIHLTEAAYKHIAGAWLVGPYAEPPIMNLTIGL